MAIVRDIMIMHPHASEEQAVVMLREEFKRQKV